MQLSPSTSDVLEALDTLSQGRLTRRKDLGTLIELAARGNSGPVLEDLCFFAKFVSKTYRLMTRIGKEGRGYETLQREFAINLQKVMDLLGNLLAGAPAELRETIVDRYLTPAPSSLDELLALCHDLGWYKNWLIDQ